jgi:hypothetical protein
MPYITRDDGEHFVVPSYRDVLSGKKLSLLKREILLLAQNYGEYIALQKKSIDQYEIAFSPEPGVLLGETVWHYFKRSRDLIYCEAIPNTAEAILVIVKSGSVYLDGSFPIDSLAEELIIFKTQQTTFDIYLYGNVSISQLPEEGKFSFDAASIKSFTVLDKPLFPTLPIVKPFQLQLVEVALRNQGIGTFPIKKILASIVALGFLWMGWTFISLHKKELPRVLVGVVNPYQLYVNRLTSPNPASQIHKIVNYTSLLFTVPGWYPDKISYDNNTGSSNKINASVKSRGGRTKLLFAWAKKNKFDVELSTAGFNLTAVLLAGDRLPPDEIHPLKEIIGNLIDKLSYVVPGNPIAIGTYMDKSKFTQAELTLSFSNLSPTTLNLVGQQLETLPLVLSKVDLTVTNGNLSGSIALTALGN